MKYSITSIVDKEKTIKEQYSGNINRDIVAFGIREIKITHRELINNNPRIKRLTTKVLELD